MFLLLGVGCQTVQPPQPEVQSGVSLNNEKEPDTTAIIMEKEARSSDLALRAEALGNSEVKFTWVAPEGLTDANRFILVEGTEENPVHDGKHNWYRQYYTNRAVIWSGRSVGQLHYRICLTENGDADTCVRYSNDVPVNVQ